MPLRKNEVSAEAAGAGPASDRDVSEFLLRACHDLRAPLRSIRVHAELLLRDLPAVSEPVLEERFGFIIDGAQRIDLLVDGLAAYSIGLQVNAGVFQTVDIAAMLRTALSGLDQMLSANGAEVTYGPLPTVQGAPDQLIQLFENLIRNTLHHRGPAAPRIRIAAEERAGEWLFRVRDNGPGVEADFLEAIFKPFERLDPARHPGPGLGLAVCRAIVSRHGGRIWCESEPGAGATFLFTLPVGPTP